MGQLKTWNLTKALDALQMLDPAELGKCRKIELWLPPGGQNVRILLRHRPYDQAEDNVSSTSARNSQVAADVAEMLGCVLESVGVRK